MRSNRPAFLLLATAFQGGLAVVAGIVAWLLSIDPFHRFDGSGQAVILGIAGTIPMLVLFGFAWRSTYAPFREIKEFLIRTLGPQLADCRLYDLAWVALLAGFSEELLFRAVLQSWLSQWGIITALLVSNLVFALAHAVSRLYFLMAGLLGIYLGVLFHWAAGENLLVPLLTHSLYDFVAFCFIRYSGRALAPEVDSTVES